MSDPHARRDDQHSKDHSEISALLQTRPGDEHSRQIRKAMWSTKCRCGRCGVERQGLRTSQGVTKTWRYHTTRVALSHQEPSVVVVSDANECSESHVHPSAAHPGISVPNVPKLVVYLRACRKMRSRSGLGSGGRGRKHSGQYDAASSLVDRRLPFRKAVSRRRLQFSSSSCRMRTHDGQRG